MLDYTGWSPLVTDKVTFDQRPEEKNIPGGRKGKYKERGICRI